MGRIASGVFDLVVIGAGIHGACVARDAALRGLKVAVLERGDLGGETSHNSLKTIHGGIRYIQHLNFARTRLSIRERTIWLRTAPHLVRPLPFLMPTYGHGVRGPAAMLAGITLYRLLGLGLGTGAADVPPGRVMGAGACRKMMPGVPGEGLTGGAVWYDAQIRFADRAVLEILADAATHGAQVASHAEVIGILQADGKATGVAVRDALTGETFEVGARAVVNAAGPWAGPLADDLPDAVAHVPLTRSMNIVTSRSAPDMAFSIKSARESDSKLGRTKRLYFMVPWEGVAIFGTTHFPATDDTDPPEAQGAEIAEFIEELNAGWPGLDLSQDEVTYAYRGLTPAEESGGKASRSHESRVLDHAATGGQAGLLSIIGVKWTTSRLVAEQAVDLAMGKLGRAGACRTRTEPIPQIGGVSYDLAGRPSDEIRETCHAHMTRTQTVTLRDMLLRRTDDFVRGHLSAGEIRTVAGAMRDHYGWDRAACDQQTALVRDRWLPEDLHRLFEDDGLFGDKT